MHVDPEPCEMGDLEILRAAIIKAVIVTYRDELLSAAGFMVSIDDPDQLLDQIVAEAERQRSSEEAERVRVAIMRAALTVHRDELLWAAGLFETSDDPDELLYRIVSEAERQYMRDSGVERRAIVFQEEFREMLVDAASDAEVGDDAVEELINAVVAEAERRWVCQIIGVDVFDIDIDVDEDVVRRRRRWRGSEEDEGRSAG